MSKDELIRALQSYDEDLEVLVYDNIGPREINFSGEQWVTKQDADNCGAMEGRVGEKYLYIYID